MLKIGPIVVMGLLTLGLGTLSACGPASYDANEIRANPEEARTMEGDFNTSGEVGEVDRLGGEQNQQPQRPTEPRFSDPDN